MAHLCNGNGTRGSTLRYVTLRRASTITLFLSVHGWMALTMYDFAQTFTPSIALHFFFFTFPLPSLQSLALRLA